MELSGLQFPSTKWWLAVNSITPHITFGNGCWVRSNIHHVPASQVNNNDFGAGVNAIYFLTVDNHAHIRSVCWGREQTRMTVVRWSKVCFNIIEHKCMMQARTVFFGSQERTKCYISGVTWGNWKYYVQYNLFYPGVDQIFSMNLGWYKCVYIVKCSLLRIY